LPFGLFCSGKTTSSSFSGNTGVSLPHTFWKKQIVRGGLTRRSTFRKKQIVRGGLTRRSTFWKKQIVRDGLTRRSTLRFCPSGFVIWKNDILSFIIVRRIYKSEKRCPRCSMGTQVFFLDWHLGCVSHNSCFQAGSLIIYSIIQFAGKSLYILFYSYFYYKFHSFQSHIISFPQTVNQLFIIH
jgi:hypothetical protein